MNDDNIIIFKNYPFFAPDPFCLMTTIENYFPIGRYSE